MCASDSRAAAVGALWPAVRSAAMVALAAAVCMAPAIAQNAPAQNTSREAEQVRRLRLQLQQLQKDAGTQQQAAQQATAERDALQRKLAATEAERKAQLARMSTLVRDGGQLRETLATAEQQQAAQTTRSQELQAALDAERVTAASLRAELALAQRQRGNLQDSLATLNARHRTQAEGLQSCIAHNAQLRLLGLELADRYERKGWGELLAVNEPFVQRSRVALENLVQGYRDKLDAEAVAAPR